MCILPAPEAASFQARGQVVCHSGGGCYAFIFDTALFFPLSLLLMVNSKQQRAVRSPTKRAQSL